ncbi:MAG: anthranilate synthase component I, partial [Haliea sp.]|nr:anthranilate synthase component I [Haliea sp.]
MNVQDFTALAAQGYNRIPVSIEVLADLETPVSTYRKLGEGAFSYFFESVQGGEKWGRYSIIGLPCRTLLRVFGSQVEVLVDGEVVEQAEVADPLAFVEAFQARYHSAPDQN